jgi:hypothetical protein
MASPTLKFKRGALAELPTLAVGEPGFTTDKYQLYIGSPSGNQLIGGGNFWNLESNTEGGGLKLYEATNNGTNYVELQAPNALGSNLELTLPSADASASGQVLQSNASGVLSFGEVALTHVDIDGGTDIGEAIADEDLFIVDNGANGTNRKTEASRIKTYVLGGASGATFSEITVGSAVTINSSGVHAPTGVITASNFSGPLIGNVTGDLTGNADSATTATSSDQVKTITNSTDADQFLTFVADDNVSATAEAVRTDAGIKYNPSSNLLTVAGTASLAGVVTAASSGIVVTGIATADTFKGTNVELTGYIEFDGAGVQIDGFVDEDNMSSNSATKLPTQQSVKAYVDTEVAGVAVTFAVAGDSGSGIVTTGTTLTIQGTSNEVDTSVSGNIVTIGLPNTVNITTELNVPTVDVGALRASDGTAAQTIADSTGKVTTSTDHEVQGTFTAAGNAVFQGNTDIGNATTDTLTVTARVDSNFVPSTNGERNLGSSSLNWDQGFIDRLNGDSANLSGIATANTFKGVSLDLSGNGEFGGNVTITGNLSVGGSVTNIDVEDLRVVSPIIELGLQRLDDGTLQPPASVTTYKPGVAMYYNHVGVSSANAKIASVFAKVQNGGDMRIGFATDIVITAVGAGDSVTSVNAWADIEAKGLWINDCAGVSQVISCTGSTRNLENITVDGGSFS